MTVPYALARELHDVPADLYEKIMADIGPTPPQGMIVHASAVVDGVVRIIEVWESKADRDRFVHERIAPSRQRHTSPSDPALEPPHDHFEISVQHLISR